MTNYRMHISFINKTRPKVKKEGKKLWKRHPY